MGLRPELDILGLGKQTRPRVGLRSETRKENTRLLCGGGNTHTQGCLNVFPPERQAPFLCLVMNERVL